MKDLLTTIVLAFFLARPLIAANEDDRCQPDAATCVTEFYPFGFSENDSSLRNTLVDVFSSPIILSENFYFYNQTIRVVYVGDNGIISLGNSYNSWNPRSLPINDIQFIVPYWADFDLTGTGNVFYRQTKDPALLARATTEIRAAFPMSENVIVINLLIATWDAVGYYSRNTDKTNTLQCILATTLTESFVMFLYADGEIQWTTGDASGGTNGLHGTEALAGINAGDGVNNITIPGSMTPSIINITQTSNVEIPGVWIFKVGEGQPSPNILLQPSGFGQNTVGQRQDLICSISVPPDVDPDTIELGWLNEDDIITNDNSRVTIEQLNDLINISSNFSIRVLVTILQFDPLFEDDEGNYSCYSIVNETELSTHVQLQTRIPNPYVQIITFDNETFANETLGNVTVGDPLTLDCTVTAVRGISSSVDITWRTGVVELRRVEDVMATIENDSAIYTDSFEISSLSVIDNGREYQCSVVINATQPVYSSDQFILIFSEQRHMSPNISLQPSGFDQNTVGQRQDVICTISVPSDVDPDTIELGWLNEDDIITNDSRVTIVRPSYNFSTSVITTIIQFDPLFEDDEGIYSCYLLTDESEISISIQLQNFRIPIPIVQISVPDNYKSSIGNETLENETLGNVTIGDPLTLDCTVTAVRGISSSVDIIWTTGDSLREVRRVDNITADVENDSAIYTDSFEISSLSTIDNGREYQCTVVINVTLSVYNSDQFTLIFPAPVCFNTTYCGGDSVSDDLLSYDQCCFDLSGVSFASSEQCVLCPKSDCTIDGVKDIVFLIGTSFTTRSYQFQMIRELVDNITISVKLNTPESSVGVILFDNYFAHIEFNLEAYTSLSTLLLAINLGLPHNFYSYGRDTASALNLLLSSAQNGSLGIRNETSHIAIVITGGRSNSVYSTQSAADALHAANIFDVYAIGYNSADINELNTIASDPNFVYYTNFYSRNDTEELGRNITDQLCSLPVPRIRPAGFLHGLIGDMLDITCSVTITSAIEPNAVELTWSNNDSIITTDNRVIITPTNITENPSSFTYSTTIQFAYLMEGDEGNYTCNVAVDDMMESHSITLQNLYIPTPRIFLRPNYLQQGVIGEPHDLVCMIALSSTAQSISVSLTWNYTSNDDRVTVISTTITTDDSGIIYTTVIQFDYLNETDEGNYTCTVTIDEDSAESTFNLETIASNVSCQPDEVTCVTEFYPFGVSENDAVLTNVDDDTSPPVYLSEIFYFYNQSINEVYVGSNGIIGLNTHYNPTSIGPLPTNGSGFIAPYSDDIDLRGTGQIFYRQTNDPSLLSRATSEIQTAFSVSLNVSNLFIATWDAVGYYPRGTDRTNTFQCVIATSATSSFVIFLYADGEIQWGNGSLAGINAGDGVNSVTIPGSLTPSIINIAQTSNVGIPGVWMFQVDRGLSTTVAPTPLSFKYCIGTGYFSLSGEGSYTVNVRYGHISCFGAIFSNNGSHAIVTVSGPFFCEGNGSFMLDGYGLLYTVTSDEYNNCTILIDSIPFVSDNTSVQTSCIGSGTYAFIGNGIFTVVVNTSLPNSGLVCLGITNEILYSNGTAFTQTFGPFGCISSGYLTINGTGVIEDDDIYCEVTPITRTGEPIECSGTGEFEIIGSGFFNIVAIPEITCVGDGESFTFEVGEVFISRGNFACNGSAFFNLNGTGEIESVTTVHGNHNCTNDTGISSGSGLIDVVTCTGEGNYVIVGDGNFYINQTGPGQLQCSGEVTVLNASQKAEYITHGEFGCTVSGIVYLTGIGGAEIINASASYECNGVTVEPPSSGDDNINCFTCGDYFIVGDGQIEIVAQLPSSLNCQGAVSNQSVVQNVFVTTGDFSCTGNGFAQITGRGKVSVNGTVNNCTSNDDDLIEACSRFGCPAEGQAFTECGSACAPTCRERNPGPCTLQCVAGCQCPNDTVLDEENNKCITVNQCLTPCPPVCSHEYCSAAGNRNKPCSRPPPNSTPTCPDRCYSTYCRACYYSRRPRKTPRQCNDSICTNRVKPACHRKWAKCVYKQNRKKNKCSGNCITAENFRCYDYPTCTNLRG